MTQPNVNKDDLTAELDDITRRLFAVGELDLGLMVGFLQSAFVGCALARAGKDHDPQSRVIVVPTRNKEHGDILILPAGVSSDQFQRDLAKTAVDGLRHIVKAAAKAATEQQAEQATKH